MPCFRLDNVEARFQETAEAFEHVRQMAKKSKSEFEMVKKQRYSAHLCSYSIVVLVPVNFRMCFSKQLCLSISNTKTSTPVSFKLFEVQ